MVPRTVRGRLLGSTALMAVLVALSAALLVGVVERHRDAAERRAEAEHVVALATRAERLVVDVQTATRGYLVTGEERFLDPYRLAVPRLPGLTREVRDEVSGDRVAFPIATRIERSVRLYLDKHARPLVRRARAGRLGRAVVVEVAEGKRRVDALRALFGSLVSRQQAIAAQRAQEAEAAARRGLAAAVALLVGTVALQVLLAWFLARSIGRPIRRTARAADRLAAGDLAARVEAEGPGELANLGRSFNRMGQALEANRSELESRHVELDAARAEADRANATKSRFLSRMGHELRTPLTAILGYSDLLGLDDLTPDQEDSVRRIHAGGQHLLALIDELVDISRIEAGEMALDVQVVEAAPVVEEAVALVAPMTQERDIRLEVSCALDEPDDAVLADRQRLRQILINLTSNAVKYNREGGSVTVSAQPAPGDTLEFAVADTGQGISPEGLERLFTPFDRLGAERSGVAGTGLGLVLTKAMIEAMGGTLEVRSVEGEGTVCRFRLAAAAREREPAA